jgi:hypothetical protein
VRFLGWGDDCDKLVGVEEIRLPLKVHPLGGYPWHIYLPIHIHRSPAEAGKGNEYLILIRLLGEQTVITGDYFYICFLDK